MKLKDYIIVALLIISILCSALSLSKVYIVEGPQGEQGSQGIQGIQGEKGDKGDKGDTGDKGMPGEKGETGEPGPQGEQGLTGPRGIQGGPGLTPFIGENGNWCIGETDTGIAATTYSSPTVQAVLWSLIPENSTISMLYVYDVHQYMKGNVLNIKNGYTGKLSSGVDVRILSYRDLTILPDERMNIGNLVYRGVNVDASGIAYLEFEKN